MDKFHRWYITNDKDHCHSQLIYFLCISGRDTTRYTPVTLIPAITQNILTVVSLLIGTSSFILGLRIQNLARSTSSNSSSPSPSIMINKYMETLILALVIPSIAVIIFGIFLVGIQLEPGDLAYLLLLFALFIPAGVILFLIRNLRRTIINQDIEEQ